MCFVCILVGCPVFVVWFALCVVCCLLVVACRLSNLGFRLSLFVDCGSVCVVGCLEFVVC